MVQAIKDFFGFPRWSYTGVATIYEVYEQDGKLFNQSSGNAVITVKLWAKRAQVSFDANVFAPAKLDIDPKGDYRGFTATGLVCHLAPYGRQYDLRSHEDGVTRKVTVKY